MPEIKNPILKQYAVLTEFLGQALGPSYEVALHDLTNKDRSIIAIANNHISGREIGAPLTNMALSIVANKSYESSDYKLNYYGVSVNGKDLRSSTLFIKDDGKLIGMLCVNFDDSHFRAVSNSVLGLCHPDIFVDENILSHLPDGKDSKSESETFRNSTEAVAADAVKRELERLKVTAERLTSEERREVIANLDAEGIFLLKGAVKEVAAGLNCSQASVYRLIPHLKKDQTHVK